MTYKKRLIPINRGLLTCSVLFKPASSLQRNNLTSIMRRNCFEHFHSLTKVNCRSFRIKWIHQWNGSKKDHERFWRTFKRRVVPLNFKICQGNKWQNLLQRFCENNHIRQNRLISNIIAWMRWNLLLIINQIISIFSFNDCPLSLHEVPEVLLISSQKVIQTPVQLSS